MRTKIEDETNKITGNSCERCESKDAYVQTSSYSEDQVDPPLFMICNECAKKGK